MFRYNFIVGFLFLCLLSASALSQETTESKIGSVLKDYYSENSPGVSVMVLKNGEVRISESYGYANLEKEIKATEKTNYHLASLTSQFTAMAVMILKDEGKANLESKITEIWSGLPDYCSKVTLNHLLNQNSGLPNLPHSKFYWDIKDFQQVKQFLNKHKKLRYKPGKKSNSNALNEALLAAYIEKVSGKSYGKFLKKRIFEPLEMEETTLYKTGLFFSISNKAKSYLRQDNNQYKPASEFQKEYYEGVTGVFSSLHDLQKWNLAWETDTLITQSTLSQAKRIGFVPGQKSFPGYGWKKAFNSGQKYLYASGIGNGNTHLILKLPREKIDVIILSNQYPLFGIREKAFELVNLFSDREYEVK
jgi:CubicO group peptidase (beta-lactamase class C family)